MRRSAKVKQKILRKYPTAKLKRDSENNLYVEINGINIAKQNLLPPTKDIDAAWFQTDLSLKIMQNINRTHPLRLQHYDSSDTKKRINARKEKTKQRNINKEYSIGYDYED